MTIPNTERAKAQTPRSLSGLLPFLRPYRGRIRTGGGVPGAGGRQHAAFPIALRSLIDGGLVSAAVLGSDRGAQVMALRAHFMELFAVAVALGLFSAARFYMVSWLGERVTADLRNAVYAHVMRQSPEFFETTQTGEVLSRLTTDTTLVQTVVGSSLSMGLRNAVMGTGALAMLVWTNPYVMLQVLLVLVLVVLPSLCSAAGAQALARQPGPRGRLQRHRGRGAQCHSCGAELHRRGPRGAAFRRLHRPTPSHVAMRRTLARSLLVGFIIIANLALLLWGLYAGTQAVMAGTITAGHLGQTVVYVIILASAFAVLGEVYGDLLRAAGATERLMELLDTHSPIRSPSSRCGRSCDGRHGGGVSMRWSSTTRRAPCNRRCTTSACRWRRARRWPWWAPAAPARAPCSSCCCVSTTRSRARSGSTATHRSATWRWRTCASASASCRRTR
jgi:ATP-binding cassette subfamily B protein